MCLEEPKVCVKEVIKDIWSLQQQQKKPHSFSGIQQTLQLDGLSQITKPKNWNFQILFHCL